MKAIVRSKFTVLSPYIKKLKRFHASNLTMHLKVLEQKEAGTHKRSRQQVIKLRAEINNREETNQKYKE